MCLQALRSALDAAAPSGTRYLLTSALPGMMKEKGQPDIVLDIASVWPYLDYLNLM
jgi:GH18 family chitinase